MKIHLREDIKVKPTRIFTARKSPLNLRNAGDRCMNRLMEADIVERVEVPTEWTSAGHFVAKSNGEARLTVDLVGLNEWP